MEVDSIGAWSTHVIVQMPFLLANRVRVMRPVRPGSNLALSGIELDLPLIQDAYTEAVTLLATTASTKKAAVQWSVARDRQLAFKGTRHLCQQGMVPC